MTPVFATGILPRVLYSSCPSSASHHSVSPMSFSRFQSQCGSSTVWNSSPLDLCMVSTLMPSCLPDGMACLCRVVSHSFRKECRSLGLSLRYVCTVSRKA